MMLFGSTFIASAVAIAATTALTSIDHAPSANGRIVSAVLQDPTTLLNTPATNGFDLSTKYEAGGTIMVRGNYLWPEGKRRVNALAMCGNTQTTWRPFVIYKTLQSLPGSAQKHLAPVLKTIGDDHGMCIIISQECQRHLFDGQQSMFQSRINVDNAIQQLRIMLDMNRKGLYLHKTLHGAMRMLSLLLCYNDNKVVFTDIAHILAKASLTKKQADAINMSFFTVLSILYKQRSPFLDAKALANIEMANKDLAIVI
ncbi:hypothetical protein SYNPS1DRAFT_31119 [Syncephalis pseudoplumigaleata]|uniref:Protein kinase domain-containing protein n=1 Tax=Syncephalis pseudoplumigaleata TaxID=1712513 RepID=A0A4P9YT73_9FUNG|nr:hypothetical protein SYNPS1DRAFT_31119 [Syncephalis pseudoplumigaleata]|eukprot:RKP23173.1 hypothetical protein SYNPS1DRAFT_31119 [Syncephalis pseudoplumigaleata]